MVELKIDKEWVKDAVQPTIDRIKAEYIHKSVIEDIKSEIRTLYSQHGDGNGYAEYRNMALNDVMKIINKYTSEDMRGDTDAVN